MGTNNLADAGENLLNAATDNAEILKDVYNDAAKPAAQEIGKALAEPIKGVTRIGRLFNAIFSSLDIWILNREYSIQETMKLLEKKLKNVPDEKLVTPPNYVFVPALQAISISIDNAILREMYAKLLAKSIYEETSAQTHPAYVDIIRQMSPIDATIFNNIVSDKKSLPIKEFYFNNKSAGSATLGICFLTSINSLEVVDVSTSLSNLIRLGLLSKSNQKLKDKSLYDAIDNNPQVCEYLNDVMPEFIKNPSNDAIVYEDKLLCLTAFGVSFYDICCTDINSDD